MKQLDKFNLEQTSFLNSNLTTRLQQASNHIKDYRLAHESVFPYQEFSLTIQDLIDIALAKEVLPGKAKKVSACFEHMLFHKYENQTYWPYQRFSFTLFEILEECMRKVDPKAIIEIKTDMRNFHKEYHELSSAVKNSISNSF